MFSLLQIGQKAKTDTKVYVPVVALSTNDNAKPLQQLKLGFKRTINWNNCQLKVKIVRYKHYLDCLINPSFQELNRLFVSSFDNNSVRASCIWYFFWKVEKKDDNAMISGKTSFWSTTKKMDYGHIKTFENLWKDKEMVTQLVVY